MNMSSERVLQLIGQHADLDVLLEAITDWVEQQIPAALISVMHFDAAHQTLSMHPSRHFSTHYHETLQDLVIGPTVGSCGVAAFSRELVITENIFNDPNWDGYYDLARKENIAACWSIPVITVDNELYGTFATYYREPRSPSNDEISVLRRAASMVALALAHYQERRLRIGTDQRYESLFHHHPDAVFEMDLDGYLTTINPAGSAITGFSPVNKIKLDRSFIQNLPDNQGDVAIVQGLITMAHLLHLQIVAEGVETAEQVEFLGVQNCDLLQGFYFAKSAPLHELVLPT